MNLNVSIIRNSKQMNGGNIKLATGEGIDII